MAQCCGARQHGLEALFGQQRFGAFQRQAALMHQDLDRAQGVNVLRAEQAAAIASLDGFDVARKLGFPIAQDMRLQTQFGGRLANRTKGRG